MCDELKINSSHCMYLKTNDLHTNVTSYEFLKKKFYLFDCLPVRRVLSASYRKGMAIMPS